MDKSKLNECTCRPNPNCPVHGIREPLWVTVIALIMIAIVGVFLTVSAFRIQKEICAEGKWHYCCK
jgi:hypothetical protein